MSQPMIVWCIIAGVLLCAFVFRAIEWYYIKYRHNGHKPIHFLEMGQEKDIFYVPVDMEDDEFEDL